MADIIQVQPLSPIINNYVDEHAETTLKVIDLQQLDEKIKETSAKYVESVYKESAIREIAFLNITTDICNVEVNQLTPRHFILLDFIKSPFLTNDKLPNEINVVDFLWIVSIKFKEGDKNAKDEFIREIGGKLDYEQSVKGIYDYLQEAFIDSPAQHIDTTKMKKTNIPFYAWVAGYIDILSSEYGWLDSYIMTMPFTRIFQYLKTIESRKMAEIGKDPILFNQYSDRVMSALRKLNKEKAQYSNSIQAIREQLIQEQQQSDIIN